MRVNAIPVGGRLKRSTKMYEFFVQSRKSSLAVGLQATHFLPHFPKEENQLQNFTSGDRRLREKSHETLYGYHARK